MKETARTRSMLILTSLALGTTAGAITTLGRYVRREIGRRGYPSWDACRCDYKAKEYIFQVLHSRNERRGETVVSHEWGIYLLKPPLWLRRVLHHGAQIAATLNPSGRYVERITLSPQEAYQLAALLHKASSNEEPLEEPELEQARIVWRRELLHIPRYSFDVCIRRLYPAHISSERAAEAQALPAIWDPHSNLPLPTEGTLLETPTGTRIDYIGWTPVQVSYCTARLKQEA